MKTISYTTNLSPTVLESYLTNTDLKDSQFFIKRSHDYMYLDITYHEDFDPVSVIYSVDKTKLKTKVYSNTTDIFMIRYIKIHIIMRALNKELAIL
jgi:hypothetical protein